MAGRKAFTLLEVLISIALMGIVLLALFSSVDILQDSNKHLSKHLKKSKKTTLATKVLYMDILSSDGNITIQKDEFTRLCMESTAHSLYALPRAKVCWLVMKDQNSLVRVEGLKYTLPTNNEDRVEVDRVMKDLEIFEVHHSNDKVLVLLKEKSKEPIKFMLQGISKPKVPDDKNSSSTTTNTITDHIVSPLGVKN